MATVTHGLIARSARSKQEVNMGQIADKDYYRDAEGNLVEEGDPKAAFLIVGKGSEVSKVDADKYGIEIGESSSEAPAEESAPEPDDKKSAAPAANKSVKPAANKKGAK